MKQNQRGRYNGRYNNPNRGSRPQTIFRNTALESSGPCGKLRGTALQLFEKYQAAAKDALIQNDEILAETCLQYADHYMHLQNIAIANETAMRAPQPISSAAPHPVSESMETIGVVPERQHDEETLQVMDLSVPVASMNNDEKDQTAQSVVRPNRRVLRPRIRRSSQPTENNIDATVEPMTE